MASTLDRPIELQTARNPTAAVIWLHGLGADGNDFAGIVPELALPSSVAVRFVFPHAPMRPVTINGGHIMRAWYDIAPSGDGEFRQNAEHIAESVESVHEMIEQQISAGIGASRVVVAGFSQGGAIALHAALRSRRRLGGVIVLSGPAPNVEELLKQASPANADLPIFLAHGKYDPMVPYAYGERLHARLRTDNRPVEWHAYDVEHGVNLDEIRDIGRFLATVLA
jgi:phospholipase/carboxylesterase